MDTLRGVGVLGLLVVHVQLFASVGVARENPTAFGDLTGPNFWVWLATYVLADGKWIAIFAMLFGAGIVLLADATERGDASAGTGRSDARRPSWRASGSPSRSCSSSSSVSCSVAANGRKARKRPLSASPAT